MSRVLIDTQALVWFAEDASTLSKRAVALVDDPMTIRLASVASIWELAIKSAIGKLTLKSGTLREFVAKFQVHQIGVIHVSPEDAIAVSDLPVRDHKDPFDRLIAVQCLRHDYTLVSIDTAFDAYGVRRVW